MAYLLDSPRETDTADEKSKESGGNAKSTFDF